MTSFGVESSGSIRNQVGQSLNSIRQCVELEDTAKMANHVRLLVALTSPHLQSLLPIQSVMWDNLRVNAHADDESIVWESCMTVLETLLPLLADAGLYAYVSAPFKPGGEELALKAEEPVPEE